MIIEKYKKLIKNQTTKAIIISFKLKSQTKEARIAYINKFNEYLKNLKKQINITKILFRY